MTNPNPGRITDELWRLWTDCPLPARLSGIYADKKGYHNTVIANKAKWPDNYSIRFPLDLVNFNKTFARAIDLTMTEENMIKWTKRMKVSAENPRDTRLSAVREFYGTLDGKTVFGMIKDSATGVWRKATADLTHLWHGHMGLFTAFIKQWYMLAPILSVWAGETYAEWSAGTVFLPELNDSGEEVKYWQYLHNKVHNTVKPPSPTLIVDGNYGPTTAKAFADFWKKSGGKGTYKGSILTGWLALQYHEALASMSAPKLPPASVISLEQLQKAVNNWLEAQDL